MDEKVIRVTVSGDPGAGKTAVIELIARCMLQAGLSAVFDPSSRNVAEGAKTGIDTEEMNKRLESIKREGNRLIILEEVDNIDAEALAALLQIGSNQYANGQHKSLEELKESLVERLSKKIQSPVKA